MYLLPLVLVCACDPTMHGKGTGGTPTSQLTSGPSGNPGSTGPESLIVPGQGACPEAATLLAAPAVARRDLYLGAISYRALDANQLNHRVISDATQYDQLKKDLKLELPAVDFAKERVVFGSVVEWGSCGMSVDPLRSVSINGTTHLDFTAVERRQNVAGGECNMSCGMVDERAFVVAVPNSDPNPPTICTRKRIVCGDRR